LPTGKEALAEVAELSGGKARTDVLEVLRDPPRAARTLPLLPWLLILGIALLLVEIAGRRLSLWERLADAVLPGAPADGARGWREWLPQWKVRLPRRAAAATRAQPAAASTAAPRPAKPATRPAAAAAAADPFEAAKQRAKRRMK
jgi:hypothetical protein